jgi:hypothetical protein
LPKARAAWFSSRATGACAALGMLGDPRGP